MLEHKFTTPNYSTICDIFAWCIIVIHSHSATDSGITRLLSNRNQNSLIFEPYLLLMICTVCCLQYNSTLKGYLVKPGLQKNRT